MGCVMVDSEGRVRQMIWNGAAEEVGLAGVSVGVKYGKDGEKDVVLLWKGEALKSSPR